MAHMAHMPFLWKTIRIKVPYEACTSQVIGPEKTCSRKTPSRNACGSIRNQCELMKWVQNFVFLKMSDKKNILTADFTILARCPMQNCFSCQLSLLWRQRKNSMLSMNAEDHFVRSQQQANTIKKRIYLDALSNNELLDRTSKQSWDKTSLSGASKNSSYARKHHIENKGHHTVCPYNKTCLSLLAHNFTSKASKPRHSQQELVMAG